MYVAFAYWHLGHQIAAPRVRATDTKIPAKPLVPESDVQRFYRERIVAAPEVFQPHVNRALRGLFGLVRGEREGAVRPSARDA